MNNRYERVYEVSLLDDLHNYFPGLLYEPDRFRSVSDVLSYIRQNTSRRFNLFDYGQRQYSQQNTIPVNTFVPAQPVVNRWTPSVEVELPETSDLSILLPLLSSLDRLINPIPLTVQPQTPIRVQRNNRFAGIFQDVVINATQEIIDGASNLRTLIIDLENMCSVCQDRMKVGDNIRTLNACQHEFHVTCIDNWLLHSSVLCPVCRHDIRDPRQALRSPLLQPTTSEPTLPHLNLNSNLRPRL
jgi:hypothetical protein